MAQVPDTNTFSLQDVVDVVNPTTDDLVDCFADAIDAWFDPAYKGSKDRLSNFRNYIEQILPTVEIIAYGFTATSKSATVTYGLTAVPFSFVPSVSGNAEFTIWLDGGIIGRLTFVDLLEDSTQYGGQFTLPAPAGYGEVYQIKVTYPAP